MLLVLLDNLVTELIGTLTGRQHYEPCLTFFVDRVRPLICCKTPRVLFGLLMRRLCSLVKLTVFVVSLAEFGDNICDFLLFLEHTLILWVYLHLLSSMLDGVFFQLHFKIMELFSCEIDQVSNIFFRFFFFISNCLCFFPNVSVDFSRTELLY